MTTRERLFSPRGFLLWGGVLLVVLGVLGFLGWFTKASSPGFWLTGAESVAHLLLGVFGLAAVYLPGVNDALRPYYRRIVIVIGAGALFFSLYGFLAGGNPEPNTFGLFNLEFVDAVLYLLYAAWAFAAAFWGPGPERAPEVAAA